jgi:hypothetical protein
MDSMTDLRSHLRPIRLAGCFGILVAFPLLAASACSNTPAEAKTPKTSRSLSVDHESCDESGNRVDKLDTNGDGKPDIRRIFEKSGRELCRVVDLNHDGRADLYEYFDAAGTIRRREFCYDDTGVVNAVEVYERGKLSQREYDTTGQHKIDTWDWFDPNAPVDAKTGRPAHPMRRERDTTGDGIIDQWWTWNGEKVSIAMDHNGDGKPDAQSIIVIGGDAGEAEGADAGASPSPASSVGTAAGSPTRAGSEGGTP